MKNSLILFDCDLRISDNCAFFSAMESDEKILPLFILDEKNKRPFGQASKWFLHFALESFGKILQQKYSLNLLRKKGDSLEILSQIFAAEKISKIYFNASIEPYNRKLQEQIKKLAKEKQIEVLTFQSQTLFDPEKIKTLEGNYFKVFTAFWNKCLKNSATISQPLKAPKNISQQLNHKIKSDDLDLLPKKKWKEKLAKIWEFDHKKIKENFGDFLKNKIHNYSQGRDIPSLEATSKLSPYLHFGMISMREVFHAAALQNNSQATKFLTEIGWREFCHHLLFHFPQLPQKNFRNEFDRFPWQKNPELFERWKKGQTGFPIVDAGMRELWATGFMHNRVRMIAASFLIKDLLIDWREGEEYFWDCLVDANLANNCAGWQWVAGSGADAAPYFRIFNPTLQSERFDIDGKYIRKWIPEIAKLPNCLIHDPSKADEKTLKSCGIELGKTYPKPILDHAKARDMALMIFKTLKN